MEVWLGVDVVELDEVVAFLKAEVAPIVPMRVDAVQDGVLDAKTKIIS